MKQMRNVIAGILVLSCVDAGQAGPLHDAAIVGDLDKAEALIAEGADVNEFQAVGAPLV